MNEFKKSSKLDHVCYDIRGPVLEEAQRLEAKGHRILKLNIGNPAPFGLTAPEEVIRAVAANLPKADGYCDSKGLYPAREAIKKYATKKGIRGVTVDDIYIGNGVSELIVQAMQGLLDNGDEILIPAPDYPLWTAAVSLAGGTAVHYLCDESSGWLPDLTDMKKKITSRTKGIVVINPNNPTGALYPLEILEDIVKLAAEHGLILFADEIYDRIIYDGKRHVSLAALAGDDLFCITLNGLSKSHRIAGFRVGWMVLSGNKSIASGYIEGLNMLASMRLCSNVPAQYAIPAALEGHQSIEDLIAPGGRLYEQREFTYKRLLTIPGISCVKPQAGLYFFPRVDTERFNIHDDEQFVLDFLRKEKVLLVQGTGFNWPAPDHFRIVFLPPLEELAAALDKLDHFLQSYRQKWEVAV